MTLHFDWLHLPHWQAHRHVNRAVTLVLGIIGVSLLFSALRVVDTAVSGTLIGVAVPPAAPASTRTPFDPEVMTRSEPSPASAPADINAVEVPDATAEAISL